MKEQSGNLTEMSKPLIEQFNSFCESYGLVGLAIADHICIKCSSHDIYEKRRQDLEDNSTFIYQSIISKRRISVIGLKEVISTSLGDIRFLELSDQKPDGSQVDSIDHIEIVPTTISYDELLLKLQNQQVEIKETVRPHHTTHDIILPSGFAVKLSKEVLVDKIKREEMI